MKSKRLGAWLVVWHLSVVILWILAIAALFESLSKSNTLYLLFIITSQFCKMCIAIHSLQMRMLNFIEGKGQV